LFPTDGLEIIREEQLSAEQQQLALKASSPQQALLYWFVDGTALGAWPSDQTVLWTPTPGCHIVRVCDSAGRWASARIKVR
jgi:membrane carboxypeptidase/penicillin-binding protein PbpC